MADVKISAMPSGDALLTGHGRVDVPVVIEGDNYQVGADKLGGVDPVVIGARHILFTEDTPKVIGNGDLFFGSESAGTAGRTNMVISGPTAGGELDVATASGGTDVNLLADVNDASLNIFVKAPATGSASVSVETQAAGQDALINLSSVARSFVEMDRTTSPIEANVPANGFGTNQAIAYLADRVGRPHVALQAGANYRWTQQPAMFARPVFMWKNRTVFGFRNPVEQGTIGTANGAVTNRYVSQVRTTYASVVTTLNQALGLTYGSSSDFLNSQGNGIGGFFFVARVGFETYKAGDRFFVGLGGGISLVVDPSTLGNLVGFGMDAGDSVISFMHNDNVGTATKTAIPGQPTVASGQGYDFYIWSDPSNNSQIYYRMDDLNGHTIIADSFVTTDLPQAAVGMVVRVGMSNGANTVAGDATLGVTQFYLDTEF